MTPDNVVGSLATAYQEPDRSPRLPFWKKSIKISSIVGYVIIILAPYLWLGWFYGDWGNNQSSWTYVFSISVTFLAFGALLLIGAVIGSVQGSKLRPVTPSPSVPAARALHAALVAQDDVILPVIPDFVPHPTETANVPMKRERIKGLGGLSLVPPYNSLITPLPTWILIGISSVSFVVRLPNDIFNGLPLTLTEHYAAYQAYYGNLSCLIPLLPITLFVLLIMSLTLTPSPPIFANQRGLWWRRFPRWEHLPWSDVRAIGRFYDTLPYNAFSTAIYVIATEHGMMRWSTGGNKGTAQAKASSARLVELAVTYTGLPVRNLNPLATALANAANTQTGKGKTLPVAPEIAAQADALFAAQPPDRPAPEPQRSGARYWLPQLGLVALLAVPYAVYYGLHDIAQPRYYAALPARITAQPPIFADPLSAPDGLWPVQQATANSSVSAMYDLGGYTLSGGYGYLADNPQGGANPYSGAYAWLPATYQSVAIQVTVTGQGVLQPISPDGVGILIRHDPADVPAPASPDYLYQHTFSTFTIDYLGNWHAAFGYETTGGFSPAIHRGLTATNTLLVIARGNLYLFYANGTYLGQYFDDSDAAGAAGQVGVTNLTSGTPATFKDFAIWSLPQPPAWP